MMRFVAIDFETANNRADSACQLAAVVVEDGVIAAEQSWLIRPPRMYFSPRNISIHGIRAADVVSSPTMETVWKEFQPLIEGEVVIAHNARFDLGVLISSLAAYDIASPDLEFNCTRSLARSAWPGRSRYGLKPLAEWLGVTFKHHDALEDSRCCATIALAIAQACEESDLAALEKKLGVRRGSYRQGVLTSPRASRGKGTAAADAWGRTANDRWGFPLKGAAAKASVNPQAVMSASAGQLPFAGRNFVFLGALRGLSVAETIQLAERLGANCQTNISAETHYVVACGQTLDEASQVVSGSLANAASVESVGHSECSNPRRANANGIRLLSERQFLALIPGGKASTRV